MAENGSVSRDWHHTTFGHWEGRPAYNQRQTMAEKSLAPYFPWRVIGGLSGRSFVPHRRVASFSWSCSPNLTKVRLGIEPWHPWLSAQMLTYLNPNINQPFMIAPGENDCILPSVPLRGPCLIPGRGAVFQAVSLWVTTQPWRGYGCHQVITSSLKGYDEYEAKQLLLSSHLNRQMINTVMGLKRTMACSPRRWVTC